MNATQQVRKKCPPDCQCGRHASWKRQRRPAEERFWSGLDRSGDCWLWTGSTIRGYGNFSVNGKIWLVHRYAYELLIGPIPDRLHLDHRTTCPKNCANPEHLRPVTRKQNKENSDGAYSNNKCGVRGVHWDARHNKWRVQISHNGRRYSSRHQSLEQANVAAVALRNRFFTHNDLDRLAVNDERNHPCSQGTTSP